MPGLFLSYYSPSLSMLILKYYKKKETGKLPVSFYKCKMYFIVSQSVLPPFVH